MTLFILGLVCALLAIVFMALYRTFSHVTPKELKRRARQGDEVAAVLYRSVSYGLSAKLILGSLAVLSAYGAFVFMVKALDTWLAFPVFVIIAMLGFVFIESKEGANRVSLWLARTISPSLAWLLERFHPLFARIVRIGRRMFPIRVHSGLYEKEDLAELLEKQKTQADNRIPNGEIDMLTNALTFGDKTVADALVPKRVVKAVSVEEAVGPVLMGELHSSGHSRFPVYEVKNDNIVGVLYLHDLVSTKRSGVVRSIMRRKVTYVHEDFTLYQTLQAFIKTKQHLFIVVNSFEEYVGIITIEDVLERVIGKLIVDEFDRYDDLRAVAAAAARKDHAANEESHAPDTAD
ncbi:CBS domain-containing protein [Candidatus Saccharibacteria bacterium]|nr:MAG: CBS domain-containing protein [Candidatus Saccharibacteria bacterium]